MESLGTIRNSTANGENTTERSKNKPLLYLQSTLMNRRQFEASVSTDKRENEAGRRNHVRLFALHQRLLLRHVFRLQLRDDDLEVFQRGGHPSHWDGRRCHLHPFGSRVRQTDRLQEIQGYPQR